MLIPYGEHPDQVIEFSGVSGPLVTLIHGGYWKAIHNRDHMKPLAEKLVENGYRVANIEYRREPGNFQVIIQDIDSALSKLNGSIALIGFSVGGQLAAIGKSEIHKIIMLAPVTDLERTKSEALGESAVINTFGDMDLSEFDPIKKDYSAHLYLIHGDEDNRVPIEHSRAFSKAKGAPLMEISGGDHFAMIDPNGLVFELILNILSSK